MTKPPKFGRNSLMLPKSGSGSSQLNHNNINLEINDRSNSNGSLKRNDLLTKSVGVSAASELMKVFRNSLTPGRTMQMSPRNRVAP